MMLTYPLETWHSGMALCTSTQPVAFFATLLGGSSVPRSKDEKSFKHGFSPFPMFEDSDTDSRSIRRTHRILRRSIQVDQSCLQTVEKGGLNRCGDLYRQATY